MTTIAYLHDGTSVYDQMFLEHLAKKHTVYFLTFWHKPRFIPNKAQTIIMREPLRLFSNIEWTEGIRMYAFFLLRALLIKLQLRRIKPQLVIGCMANKYGFYTTFAGFKPTILIVWGTDILVTPKRSWLFRYIVKHTLKKTNAVILDSQVQENAAVQLGCNPNKILKFPWFNSTTIKPETSRSQMREKLGWQDNVIVLSARSHEPVYGVENLIEAIPEIVKNQPQTRFLILGKGRLTPNLKQRTKQLQIQEYVKFVGNVPREEVIAYLNASDIYVSTSFSDGTSASLLEAMTLALPSIVTDIPGNKEWITNTQNGYLIPIRNPKTLAEKIIQLARDKELRKTIGENAHKTVQEKVNWQKNTQALDQLIHKLIQNNERTKTIKQQPHNLLIITEDSPESYSPAGERIHHLALAGSLKFREVTVLALETAKKTTNKQNQPKSGSAASLYTINFTRAMPFPLSAFFDPVKTLMLLTHGIIVSRRIKPSHILASMPPLETGTSAWLLSKLLHVPLIIDLRDDWESAVGTQLKRYFPTLLINALSTIAEKTYTSANAILAVTETINQTLRKRGIHTRLLFVPNGADTTIFQPQLKAIQAKTRRQYALPPNKTIAVYCGSGINPYYRLDQLLASIIELLKETSEKLFFVFYVYNGHKHLNQLKHQLGILDNQVEIRNPLPRNQLAKVLSACDIGLVPFDAKPYLLCARSTKMYEYLASGLFVISSGPKNGELDMFFSTNPALGLFTLPTASNFAEALQQVTEKAETLLDNNSRKLRYGFIRRNYDRQIMMSKALDALFAVTPAREKATPQ